MYEEKKTDTPPNLCHVVTQAQVEPPQRNPKGDRFRQADQSGAQQESEGENDGPQG